MEKYFLGPENNMSKHVRCVWDGSKSHGLTRVHGEQQETKRERGYLGP